LTRLRRAFVAVVPPPEVLDAIESVVAPVRPVAPPRVTWTHAGQWHLTLQFLGSVPEADVDDLVDSLHAVLRREPPVTLALGGAGAFPSPSRASVLWIGLDEGQAELARVAAAVARATAPFGYAPDHPEFTAHLTVARSHRARPLANVITSLGEGPVGPRWDATDVVLMESDTRSDGAVYNEVEHFSLAG
jgi:RNA 2',3'-cyclic 3'-phosphodiesterase